MFLRLHAFRYTFIACLDLSFLQQLIIIFHPACKWWKINKWSRKTSPKTSSCSFQTGLNVILYVFCLLARQCCASLLSAALMLTKWLAIQHPALQKTTRNPLTMRIKATDVVNYSGHLAICRLVKIISVLFVLSQTNFFFFSNMDNYVHG